MDSIGERIKTLRQKLNLTQKELGDIVGLHSTNIGRIEKNLVNPTSTVIISMADLFGVTCDWLLTGNNAFSHKQPSDEEKMLINLYRRLYRNEQLEIINNMEFKISLHDMGKSSESKTTKSAHESA